MLYVATTISSWILLSITKKAIYSRLSTEGYEYIPPKKTKAEIRQEKAKAALLMCIPVVNIMIASIMTLSFDRTYSHIKHEWIKEGKIKKKEEHIEDQLKDTIVDSNLEELEKKLLLNVFEFNDVTVKEVMTPKKEVISLDIDDSNDILKQKVRKTKYTRFPVTKNGKIMGILNIKDFIVNETHRSFKKNIRKVTKIKSDTILDDAFMLLNESYEPIAVVEENKEYIGIITMEDILEHIIGDIFDEYDKDKTKE